MLLTFDLNKYGGRVVCVRKLCFMEKPAGLDGYSAQRNTASVLIQQHFGFGRSFSLVPAAKGASRDSKNRPKHLRSCLASWIAEGPKLSDQEKSGGLKKRHRLIFFLRAGPMERARVLYLLRSVAAAVSTSTATTVATAAGTATAA